MNIEVVIIDDDAVVLFLHKILVQKSTLSSTLRCFNNATEAHSYLCTRTSKEPLLVLLDINMPHMNGWEFLEKIDQDACDENIWVVMVTSSINTSDRERAQKYRQVVDYVEKPLSVEACDALHSKIQGLFKPS